MLTLADALTSTPANVTPDVFAELERAFSPEQVVEIASAIAWENYRARNNRVFHVESEGYTEGAFCLMPVRTSGKAYDQDAGDIA